MAVSLYDISVGNYLQALAGVNGFLDKAATHCKEKNIDLAEIMDTRLIGDMLPFRFQLQSVMHHSLGSIEGVKTGLFAPPGQMPPHDYATMHKMVGETRDKLKAMTADEVNALSGKDVTFQFGDFKMPFIAENFVLSFSLPNLHFHAATAYDILRQKGVPLGKRDFMGPLRLKR